MHYKIGVTYVYNRHECVLYSDVITENVIHICHNST